MTSTKGIELSDLDDRGPVELSDFSVVSSYNWLDEPQPTILVPGAPPIWSPPSDAPALKPDAGARYVDQNADRMPHSPLEPFIQAILSQRPAFDFSGVDIITDRKTLRQLYGFSSGEKKRFEFGVEAVGDTTIFTRVEPRSREIIAPNTFAGYRQSFEEAYTKLHSAAKGSTSHSRLITYTIGGLTFLVRSGTDAYRPDAVGQLSTPQASERDGSEEFAKNIKTLSLDKETASVSATPASIELQVIKGGFEVSQAAVLELSTHTATKPSIIEDKLIDLYLAQSPCFVEATFRSSGPWNDPTSLRARFRGITMTDTKQQIMEWEENHQNELRKLVNLVEQIISEARALGGQGIIRYTGQAIPRLEVEAVGERKVPSFPEKFKTLFHKGQWESGL